MGWLSANTARSAEQCDILSQLHGSQPEKRGAGPAEAAGRWILHGMPMPVIANSHLTYSLGFFQGCLCQSVSGAVA